MTGLHHFRRTLDRDMRLKRNGPVRKALNRWVELYAEFIYERFNRLSTSGGGGEWPDIEDETKLRKGFADILVETGQMRDAINPRFTKRQFRSKPFGVIVHFGNDDIEHRSSKTTAQLIHIHQRKRPIIVSPNVKTIREAQRIMREGIRQAGILARRAHRSSGGR